MKYLLLSLLLVSAGSYAYDDYSNPDRFKEFYIPDTSVYLLKDNQTGCEYISDSGRGSSWTLLQHTCLPNTGKRENKSIGGD